MKSFYFIELRTSNRSISNRDASDDIPSEDDEPKSDVVRERTSI